MLRSGSFGMAVWLLFILGLGACSGGIGGLVSSSTPTLTATATLDFPATAAEGTRSASTATAAVFASQTIQASATAAALTATAAFQQTLTAATRSALQTQTAVFLQAQAALEQAVLTICGGSGVPEAAPYADQRAFHPILLTPDQYPYPQEARPETLSQLELVACIEERHLPVAGFPYTDGTGTVRACHEDLIQLIITVRAAQTGRLIFETTVEGAWPYDLCSPLETFAPGQTEKHKSGPPPDPALVWEAIKDLVYLELK